MDKETLFHIDLVALDIKEDDREGVIRLLGDLLVTHRYVAAPYIDAVIDRERETATGLPTKPIGIAIPHADPEHVLQSGVAVGVLARPVPFGAMGSPGQTIAASLVFMMAVREPDQQINRLQQLVRLFRRPEILEQLAGAETPQQVMRSLKTQAGK